MEPGFLRLASIHGIRALTIADKVAIAFCIAAVAFLACGNLVHIDRVCPELLSLSPLDAQAPPISGTGFATNAVYPTTALPCVQGNLKFYGSWLRSNAPTGSVHTMWYRPVPQFYVFVAGYPKHPNNQLIAEVETAHSGVVRVAVSDYGEPGESWWLKEVSLRKVQQPVKFRVVAIDGSTDFWLGFSQPFLMSNDDNLLVLKQLLLVILATAASIVVFIFPGLVLRENLLRRWGRGLPFILIPVPGVLILALLALISWMGPHQLGSALISRAGLWGLVLYVTYWLIRVPVSKFTNDTEIRVLLAVLVLSAIAVAKATYSVGPAGELFQDEISRTLEVGNRIDSVMSFKVVQLVAFQSRPFSPFANRIYEIWNFSHRGPINGLAATPLVLASPVRVPTEIRTQSWSPFDSEGFSAYRIAMIVMASSSLLAVFGLATLFLSDEWAFFAFLVTITAPFVVHELYFTWPKLPSSLFVLLAAYLVLRSRYFLSGLSLGVGYLCHPSALVWFPCLAGVLVVTPYPAGSNAISRSRRIYQWSYRSFSILAGVAVCVLLWKRVNGKHFAQLGFSSYFFHAGPYPPTLVNWLRSRFESLCNTLVPLSLFIFDRSDPFVNSVEGPSPRVVQFFFQYWDTLPFGVGIAFFCCGLIRLVFVAFWKARAWLLLVFVMPFALFTVYWGATISGMLRENLHAWFLGFMIFAVVVWNKYLRHNNRFWQICKWALLFRGVEILLMLLLPAISTQHMLLRSEFAPTDILALLTMVGGTTWIAIYTFRFAQSLSAAEQTGAQVVR